MIKSLSLLIFVSISSILCVGCQQGTNNDQIKDTNLDNNNTPEVSTTIIESYFSEKALVEDISITDCTLSDGTKTNCYKITVTHGISEEDIGPRCPNNIADSAEAGGIWFENGKIYDISGEFIENLSELYGDKARQLYNKETGEIRRTETKEAFEAAARPDVAEEFQNYCVQGLLSFVESIPTEYYYIPTSPQKATNSQEINNSAPIGVAFNGIRIEAPAPVENILGAYTIAAFDDCGGHVNPYVGYHYHAENGCAPRIPTEDHPDLIGLALDGFEIYEYDKKLTDLDKCGGHTDETRGYHYHLADPGLNQQLGCFSGGYGCTLSEDGSCDASAKKRRGPPGR